MDLVCFSAYPRFVRPFYETGCPTWTNGIFRPSIPVLMGKETLVAGIVAVGLAVVLFIQDSPVIYYAYAGFPVFFWEHVLSNRETIWLGLQVLTQRDGKQVSLITVATQSILYIGILESLVLTLLNRAPLC
jgi:GPI ethanolamine phosphate transferase 1